jgi:hypothetical protein
MTAKIGYVRPMQPRTTLYALFHWVNLTFIAGATWATIHTGEPSVLAGAAALELLWLTGGSRSSFFQRYAALRNAQIDKKTSALRSLEAQQQLGYEYKQRYRDLEKTKNQLVDAAKSNKRMEQGALTAELQKVDELLASFIRIAVAHKKLGQYLAQTTLAQLQADVEAANTGLESATDPSLKTSLEKQRELAQYRITEHDKIVQNERALGVQLDTIEKTVAFLRTKVMSFDTPSDLGSEIESVVRGVEAAERTLAATDALDAEIEARVKRAALSH